MFITITIAMDSIYVPPAVLAVRAVPDVFTNAEVATVTVNVKLWSDVPEESTDSGRCSYDKIMKNFNAYTTAKAAADKAPRFKQVIYRTPQLQTEA